MKKIIAFVLVVLALVGLLAVSALAAEDLTNYAFGYTGQCVNTTTLSNAGQFHTKGSTKTYIEVRHSVTGSGSDAGFTNLMHAYRQDTASYLGAKWQAPDGIYYSCTSTSIVIDKNYTPGGRGNTKYNEELGLTSVRMEGQNRVH